MTTRTRSSRPGYRRPVLPAGRAGRAGRIAALAAIISTTALVVLLVVAAGAGLWKLAVIGVVSYSAMIVGAVLGRYAGDRWGGLQWAHGLAGGAMLASAAIFLLPVAIRQAPTAGGIGIAVGLLAGWAVRASHDSAVRSPLVDHTVLRLSLHAISAGVVIGAIYAELPDVGLLLGLSITSHKGPAGYAAAEHLQGAGRSVLSLAVPAAGVGIPAAAIGLAGVSLPPVASAVVFGAAAGLFLQLTMDFLPSPPVGEHGAGGRTMRPMLAGLSSTVTGAAAVLLAWAIIASL